jgi:putative hydrolase of the HAD superfamily
MFFDTALVDLDDTLYSYEAAHRPALFAALTALASASGVDLERLKQCYESLSVALKDELGMTAASHNRFIYFKQLCLSEKITLAHVSLANNIYWETFYAEMQPAKGARELLQLLRNSKVKIGILSDFQIEYQFEKLRRLGLLELVDDVITSEEVGVEKPNSKMFLSAVASLGASASRTIMVGDHYKKDILGANRCGIQGILVKSGATVQPDESAFAFENLLDLKDWVESMAKAVSELVKLSIYCGMRYDLTQAAGGNISVKSGSHMLIKSSGIHLADVGPTSGYSVVNNRKLKTDLGIRDAAELNEYAQFSTSRPSIETYMHARLSRYVVHLHPLQINALLTAEGGGEMLMDLMPQAEIIEYVAPGLDLAYLVNANGNAEQVIYLLNHGVIFATDQFEAMVPLIERTLDLFEGEYSATTIDTSAQRLVNALSAAVEAITGEHRIAYICEDAKVLERIVHISVMHPAFPDAVVYCGARTLQMPTLDESVLGDHIKLHGIPKLVMLGKDLYILDLSLTKCREVEAVLKSQLLLQDGPKPRKPLSDREVTFLDTWDAEKYRRTLKH